MKMERTKAVVGAAAVVLGLSATALGGVVAQEQEGKAIFEGKGTCFVCHGKDAKGTVLAPDLTDGEWLNFPGRPTAKQARELVTEGVPKPRKHPAPMLPMAGVSLSDEELAQVVDYVLSLTSG